ncbi:MAG: SRPBCC family protein, partial [Bacteroidota bacterium]
MHIEVPKKKVAKSAKDVFDFLTDIKNFETLMPDNIDKFEVLDDTTFRFALKGMPEIVLRLKEQLP